MRFWWLAIAIALGTPNARAQTNAGEEAAPKLVPPKQLSAPPVPYPAGAKGDAVVTLQLVIRPDGSIESVTVVSTEGDGVGDGEEPFAAAARTSAEAWRFEPATRDGVPVRATIRAAVTFKEPAKAAPPPPAPLKPPPLKQKKGQPKVSDAPVDITVEGERKEIAQTSVSGGEVRILPGAFGDPFRMVEALPGVVPVFSGLPFFYVRGAPPGNIGYFIDGVRVPMLFHLGAGPSVLAPGIIDRVDFHPSAYPARFGRNAGAIIAGETLAPAKRMRGEWNVRLFDASAMVEAPFRDKLGNQRGDVMVAGRYGYPGLLLSLLSSEVGLQYWDYQVRAGYNVNDRDRLSTFFFGAFDRLVDKNEGVTLFDVQFHRADLRWDRTLPDGRARVATTWMFDQTGIGDGGRNRSDRFAVRMLGTGLRGELEKRLSPEVLFRSGADVWLERYSLLSAERGGDGDTQANLFPTRTDIFAGTRLDFVLRPTPEVELVPGVRFDVYSQGAIMAPAVEPRLATRLKVARRVWTISTLGLAHQTAAFVIPAPGLRLGSLARGLQEAWQFGQGVEVEIPKLKTRATMTAFYTGFRNMSDVIAVCAPGADEDGCKLDARINGRAYGLEVMLKRDLTEKIGGWLAYTLSRSTRSSPGRTAPSDFDRTHVLSAVFSWDLGKGYRFGSRFSFQTGRPWSGFVTRPGASDDDPSNRRLLRQRLPEFWRLDVRFEKRWIYSDTTSLAFVVEWFNMLLKKEPIEYRRCGYDGTNCRLEELGPVTIPSLGLEGTY